MFKFLMWLIGIVVVFLAIVFGLSIFLSPDNLADCGNRPSTAKDCKTADVIVAISGGDTGARAEKAVDLYKNGWADKIIFAGAAADPNSPSNAEQMRDIALADGVPAEAIIIEKNSANTIENAKNVTAILKQNGWQNVILVSENYHLRRAGMLFATADKSAAFRTTSAQVDNGWWLTPRGWTQEFSELGGIIKFWVGGGKI